MMLDDGALPLKEKVFPSAIGRGGVFDRASSAVPGIGGIDGEAVGGGITGAVAAG